MAIQFNSQQMIIAVSRFLSSACAGINRGGNTGINIYYSGTVAAAREATFQQVHDHVRDGADRDHDHHPHDRGSQFNCFHHASCNHNLHHDHNGTDAVSMQLPALAISLSCLKGGIWHYDVAAHLAVRYSSSESLPSPLSITSDGLVVMVVADASSCVFFGARFASRSGSQHERAQPPTARYRRLQTHPPRAQVLHPLQIET